MPFKRCTACGKEVRIADRRCWNCQSVSFADELVEGTPGTVAELSPVPSAESDQLRCPKCRSGQVAAGTKGFGLGKAAAGGLLLGPIGLLGGLIGSKKPTVSCLRCGYQWAPGG